MPAHFEKVYAHWMENIHDWAVGRQLWWGHRIPAWFCPDGHVTVSDSEDGPDACAECGRPASDLTQETDIFDTWFSSGLWPFSTLGWPDETPDMARFYPTSVMETGYDILFFWVARMMMLGLFSTSAEPFHTVYLHGMIRAEGGVKMSKTKGNSVDPLDVVDEIGADALRFALVNGSAPGSDQRLTQAKLDGGRNFTNKLWNARASSWRSPEDERTAPSRLRRRSPFAGSGRASAGRPSARRDGSMPSTSEATRDRVRRRMERLLRLVPGDGEGRPAAGGCVRGRPRGDLDGRGEWARTLLRLLHPLMPFVTEEIWQALRDAARLAPEPLLVPGRWPEPGSRRPERRGRVRGSLGAGPGVRNLRTEAGTPRRRGYRSSSSRRGRRRRSAGTRASLPRGAGSRSSD